MPTRDQIARPQATRVLPVAAGVVFLLGSGAASHADTPNGHPAGFSAQGVTGLEMRQEHTEFVFHTASDSAEYSSRLILWNPQRSRIVRLLFDLRDAQWAGATDSSDIAPPVVSIAVNGRPIPLAHGESSFQWRFQLDSPSRRQMDVRATTTFRWEPDDCQSPPFTLGWRVSSDSVFDVRRADRTVVFRFDPPVSLMAVRNYGDSAVFERGTIVWHWQGAAPAFWIGYEPNLANEYTDNFPGRYTIPLGYTWDNEYLGYDSSCDIPDIEWAGREGNPDSMTTEIRAWVEDYKRDAVTAIDEICRHHGVSSTAAESLLTQGLAALNPVERRNLRLALALVPILDVNDKPTAIVRKMDAVWSSR